MTGQDEFTLGVEEEFLLVDAVSRRLRPEAEEVLPHARRQVPDQGQVRGADRRPPPLPRAEFIRTATWRAARYGLEDDLIDVVGERSVPAPEMVETLLGFLRPAMEEHDEWENVSDLVHRIVRDGTGAARQRRAFERGHRLEDVVDLVVQSTTCPSRR